MTKRLSQSQATMVGSRDSSCAVALCPGTRYDGSSHVEATHDMSGGVVSAGVYGTRDAVGTVGREQQARGGGAETEARAGRDAGTARLTDGCSEEEESGGHQRTQRTDRPAPESQTEVSTSATTLSYDRPSSGRG